MKNILTALSVFVAIASKGQSNIPQKDSIKLPRNEIGFNILPVISFLGGALPIESARYSLNYRHYLNKSRVIRVAVSAFPYQTYNSFKEDGALNFHQLSDTNLIYKNTQNKQKTKFQLNIGYEWVYRSKKLIQSVGADVYFNYQHSESREIYYWTGKSTPFPNSIYKIDLMNNKVDSMGANTVKDKIGFGVQLFYNLRIPITKHWLISSTIGPSMSMNQSNEKNTIHKSGNVLKVRASNFDFDAVLFSDLSICYRF